MFASSCQIPFTTLEKEPFLDVKRSKNQNSQSDPKEAKTAIFHNIYKTHFCPTFFGAFSLACCCVSPSSLAGTTSVAIFLLFGASGAM